jgi:ribosomal protein L37AE/L43A
MAKGNRCPACGELTFHRTGAVYECSNIECGATGWWNEPGSPGAGRGHTCQSCGGLTCKKVASKEGVDVWHCSQCRATYLTA